MIPGRILRILKPIGAGVAAAFLVTALVDGPPPVHFQPENPYAAKQAEIVEPQAALVIEKNIMKLGSLLSVPEGDPVMAHTPVDPHDAFDFLPGLGGVPTSSGPSVKGEVVEPQP